MGISVLVLRLPARRSLSGAEGGGGFDQAVAFELAEHVLYVLWRPGPRIGRDTRGDGPSVDADLVQHEGIGGLGLDVPLPEVSGWEMPARSLLQRPDRFAAP